MATFVVALVGILPKDVTTKSETDGCTFGSYQVTVSVVYKLVLGRSKICNMYYEWQLKTSKT